YILQGNHREGSPACWQVGIYIRSMCLRKCFQARSKLRTAQLTPLLRRSCDAAAAETLLPLICTNKKPDIKPGFRSAPENQELELVGNANANGVDVLSIEVNGVNWSCERVVLVAQIGVAVFEASGYVVGDRNFNTGADGPANVGVAVGRSDDAVNCADV